MGHGATNNADIEATTIWLRTHDDPHSLASLSSDPLYLALTGILAIGSIVALLLALLGNLTISWLRARSSRTNFAVMRALGSTRSQIAAVIGLEQSIIYATAIMLGLAIGLLLAFIVLPGFIFTTIVNNGSQSQVTSGEFYVVQNVPPIQLIIPYAFIFIALVILVIICGIALAILVRLASRPPISMTLRLNED